MKLLLRLLQCRHKLRTFPQGVGLFCHQTCIDCGKQIPYDWKHMRERPSIG